MGNSNTSAAVYNLSIGNVTAETAFASLSPLGGSSTYGQFEGGTGTVRAVAAPSISPKGSFDTFDGRPVRLFADFLVTAGGSLNTTLKIYQNAGGNTNTTTLTNDVLVFSTGTMASGGAKSGVVSIEVILYWDSVQQALGGYTNSVFKGILAEGSIAIVAPTVLNSGTSIATAVTTEQLAYGVGFFATALFGTSNAANAVILKELSLTQI